MTTLSLMVSGSKIPQNCGNLAKPTAAEEAPIISMQNVFQVADK